MLAGGREAQRDHDERGLSRHPGKHHHHRPDRVDGFRRPTGAQQRDPVVQRDQRVLRVFAAGALELAESGVGVAIFERSESAGRKCLGTAGRLQLAGDALTQLIALIRIGPLQLGGPLRAPHGQEDLAGEGVDRAGSP